MPLPIETSSLIPDPSGFDWIHRKTDDTDFYFVVNYRNDDAGALFIFRQKDRHPELWDPITGAIRDLSQFEVTKDNRIRVPLKFAPRQSYFIVFRKPLMQKQFNKTANFPDTKVVQELSGEWIVSFDPKRGGPADAVTFEKLSDWKDNSDERIKYYSGIARYSKKFTFNQDTTKEHQRIIIDLGQVEIMARVFLNGKYCGSVWTTPWRVDITEALQAGENMLEIEIVNMWRNRLLGDAKKPQEQRITKINLELNEKEVPKVQLNALALKSGEKVISEKLAPSGLIGPVKITRDDYKLLTQKVNLSEAE